MRAALLLALCCGNALATGWSLQRLPNLADGGPAFAVISPAGMPVTRIECQFNKWVDTEELATRIMSSRELMANIAARQGKLTIDDLGPAKFDCVPLPYTKV